jgi:hypothetical protein
MMNSMQNMGRNGDTRMAHVAPGEMVVPRQVMQNNPQMARGIASAIRSEGADPRRYMVGTPQNSINPNTGQPEFFLSGLLSAGAALLGSNAARGALTSLALRKLQGKKAGLREALIGSILGEGIGGAMGKGTSIANMFGNSEAALDLANARDKFGMSEMPMRASKGSSVGQALTDRRFTPAKELVQTAARPIVDPVKTIPQRVFKEDLMGIGELGSSVFPSLKDEDNILGKLLNTKAGEALLFGLGSQGLSALFDDDDESEAERKAILARANRPFGHGNYVTMNTMRELAQGGETTPDYFPRRNGGIMPSEGSGTKDDVPAMLMAGEFVLTKDAIKGLGNGNQRQGIAKAYDMQNQLEQRART